MPNTYYVRKSGSDSNAGTSAGAAWLTIDKAANTVAAGDTVYVGAGAYLELVTMDTSGTSGNQISFIADTSGYYTGDAGDVYILSFDDPYYTLITRSYCWNMNGKEFITVSGFVMQATVYAIHDNLLAGNRAYEGVIIENCVLHGRTSGINLDFNEGVTPTANGLTIRNCKSTSIQLNHDTNTTAHQNVKAYLENLEIHKYADDRSGSSDIGVNITSSTSGNSFSIGGITASFITIYGGGSAGLRMLGIKNTTNVSKVSNLKYYGTSTGVVGTLGTTAAVEVYSCLNMSGGAASSGVTIADQGSSDYAMDLIGGFGDFCFQRTFGYSPFLPGEAISNGSYVSGSINRATGDTNTPTTDIYGNPRQMGRPSGYGHIYYFDASDAAVSDPNNVWTNESNVVDSSQTTTATTSTNGSASSNYVMAEGTNAPSSGDTIVKVQARMLVALNTGTTSTPIEAKIYTDALAENIGTLNYSPTSTTPILSAWTDLSTPSGGWTWAKVQALEFKAYRVSGSTAIRLYMLQVGVLTDKPTADTGAVEATNRPTRSSTQAHAGTYSARFDGAGIKSFWRPVSATSTTISVYTYWDSNYSGSKPKMIVSNIPGVAEQTDTATGSASTWEQLSCTFTPTLTGWVKVTLISQDSSTNGYCYFDDLAT